jgi:hypothetical protein
MKTKQATPDADDLDSPVAQLPDNGAVDETSLPYVGRWNRLVSTTNWEKGRIIYQWREASVAADAPAAEYSDEAWARLVGGVTGQHVGRLRRVCQRFGQVYEEYKGLYWSHFQAALEWDDAEMWLEGAVQSRWSVSQMRRQRWETLGGSGEHGPSDEDVIAGELDEDFEPAVNQRPLANTADRDYDESRGGPAPEGPDFGEEESAGKSNRKADEDGGASIFADDNEEKTIKFVRPFENLAELPDDMAEAFEAYKLAILRHKADDWQQISRDDVLASLDALKELALAPSAEESPF